jgi:hypothetical protein
VNVKLVRGRCTALVTTFLIQGRNISVINY